LRTATSALVHSAAEYCGPTYCHSAHTRLTDSGISDALPTVTGCLRPTPANNLAIVALIQPPELRRKEVTLYRGAWTSAPLSAHLSIEWECTASQIEIPICTRRTTTHQFIFRQQHTVRAALWADPRRNAKWLVVGEH